jgi:hypothetical protein
METVLAWACFIALVAGYIAYGRWLTRRGVPKKGHTIRMRMNAFVAAVQAEDQGIDVRVKELRGR